MLLSSSSYTHLSDKDSEITEIAENSGNSRAWFGIMMSHDVGHNDVYCHTSFGSAIPACCMKRLNVVTLCRGKPLLRSYCKIFVWNSVVSVANVSFEWTNLLSEQSEWNLLMNWFVAFSIQLSSAVIMPAGSGTAATHSENCEDVILVRVLIRSWFANLLHTENCRWGCDSFCQSCSCHRGLFIFVPFSDYIMYWLLSG